MSFLYLFFHTAAIQFKENETKGQIILRIPKVFWFFTKVDEISSIYFGHL